MSEFRDELATVAYPRACPACSSPGVAIYHGARCPTAERLSEVTIRCAECGATLVGRNPHVGEAFREHTRAHERKINIVVPKLDASRLVWPDDGRDESRAGDQRGGVERLTTPGAPSSSTPATRSSAGVPGGEGDSAGSV